MLKQGGGGEHNNFFNYFNMGHLFFSNTELKKVLTPLKDYKRFSPISRGAQQVLDLGVSHLEAALSP